MKKIKFRDKVEYGDFQTPKILADLALSNISIETIKPNSIIEPTCGKGEFLIAAYNSFPNVSKVIGLEINQYYLAACKAAVNNKGINNITDLIHGDFFLSNWDKLLNCLPTPILIVGNPPWVTSSELGAVRSNNLPQKSNFQKHRGFDAITGKSNFDISEWMLLKYLDWLQNRPGIIAVLCKTSVARKILRHAWSNNMGVSSCQMYLIDSQKYFNASVDACFLVIRMDENTHSMDCKIFDSIDAKEPSHVFGYFDGLLLNDIDSYKRTKHLRGIDNNYQWRSGIKHDCSKVMELEKCENSYRNGFGEFINIEEQYLYPMLKSSDLAKENIPYGKKYMIVPQKYVGEDTNTMFDIAPKTWKYLSNNEEYFNKRASSIYRNRPKFSVFGIGKYSFSFWKVAISGFYKSMEFRIIEPYNDKPVVVDDTVYFIPCSSQREAAFIVDLLNTKLAQYFYRSMVFWSNKRPITSEILKRLDIHALSVELGRETEYLQYASKIQPLLIP